MKNLVSVIVIAGALAGGYVSFQGATVVFAADGKKGAAPAQAAPAATPVTAAEAISRDVLSWHDFSGRMQATEQVEIRPRVTGTIESIHFDDGALVKKGDLLFKIDARPFEAEVKRAEAAVNSARAQITLAKNDKARGDRLMKEKAIPQREFDEMKNKKEIADAGLAAAEAALVSAQLNLEYTEIRAPIDGRASRAEITVGNIVQGGSGSPPLLSTLVSYTPIYAAFDMDEQTYLDFTKAGALQKADNIPVSMTLASDDGKVYTGTVHSFDNHLDPASGTVRVRAIFDNPDGRLIPGLFAKIHIGEAAKRQRVLISDRAVGTDQDRKFVYIVKDDNTIDYRPVKLGDVVDGLRSIEEGLSAGDKVVVRGLQRIRPGAPVTAEIIPMDQANSDAPDAAAAPQK